MHQQTREAYRIKPSFPLVGACFPLITFPANFLLAFQSGSVYESPQRRASPAGKSRVDESPYFISQHCLGERNVDEHGTALQHYSTTALSKGYMNRGRRIMMGGLILAIGLGLGLAPLSVAHAATSCVATETELLTALFNAESNGEDDLIQFVQGTYVGNFLYSSAESFNLTIEGGWDAGCVSRTVDPTNTVLDGNASGTTLALSSTALSDYVVDGLTVQNGSASGNAGGLFVVTAGGDVTLTDNTITGNSTTGEGGGVSVTDATTVTLTDNTISTNSSDNRGGGVYVTGSRTVTLTDNTISTNSSGNSGGRSTAHIL